MTINLSDEMITTLSIALTHMVKDQQQRLAKVERRQQLATATTAARLLPAYRRRARDIENLTSSIRRYQGALDLLAGLHSVAMAEQGRC